MAIAFGPVPSRRLGRSLGINNIPPKSCSYSCLYCQVGPTHGQQIELRQFYTPEAIFREVSAQLQTARGAGEPVDYLTFVPDGEPTLDIHLGEAIDLLRPLKIPIAVISNASLLWREEVRMAIAKADWVSVKVDSVEPDIWRRLNQPHQMLQLSEILAGIRLFARQFQGELVSETMLIQGVNDDEAGVQKTAEFLAQLDLSLAYLAIPTRPTAETGIRGPGEAVLNRAYQLFSARLPHVEYLIGYEGDAFASSGDARRDLLSITAVHPMRESAVKRLLVRAGKNWDVVDELLAEDRLKQVEYLGRHYYVHGHERQNQT
jgi:wyosine [tRNA(Phe)-imidazoG37] synthetase (radical SAM superfamily)